MPGKVKPPKRPVDFTPFLHKPNKGSGKGSEQGFIRLSLCSPTDEAFSMHDIDGWQYHWNVTRARTIAEQSGQLFRFRPADFSLTLDLVKEQYPDMDADYAMTTNLSRPLLLTLFVRQMAGEDEPNTLQLLDGWHRLYKALLTGVEYLPVYLLTQEQSDAVLFAKMPPGRGIDWGQNANRKGGSHARQVV